MRLSTISICRFWRQWLYFFAVLFPLLLLGSSVALHGRAHTHACEGSLGLRNNPCGGCEFVSRQEKLISRDIFDEKGGVLALRSGVTSEPRVSYTLTISFYFWSSIQKFFASLCIYLQRVCTLILPEF